jgi:hypothetical protein
MENLKKNKIKRFGFKNELRKKNLLGSRPVLYMKLSRKALLAAITLFVDLADAEEMILLGRDGLCVVDCNRGKMLFPVTPPPITKLFEIHD